MQPNLTPPIPIVDETRSLVLTRKAWADGARRTVYLLRDVPDVPHSIDRVVLLPHTPLERRTAGDALRLFGLAHPRSLAQRDLLEGYRVHGVSTVPSELLGFDVADPGISAISNCGYGSDLQRVEAAKQWGGALDDRHLFRDLATAIQFADFSDGRVPEHEPFAVVALYGERM